MRRGGTGARQGSCEATDDEAVKVPAHDPFDLGVAADDRFEVTDAIEPHLVHFANTGEERRVMHQHDRHAVRGLGQACVQPLQSLGTEPPAALSRNQRIERHQPHRPVLYDVLQEAASRGR